MQIYELVSCKCRCSQDVSEAWSR